MVCHQDVHQYELESYFSTVITMQLSPPLPQAKIIPFRMLFRVIRFRFDDTYKVIMSVRTDQSWTDQTTQAFLTAFDRLAGFAQKY